jgi:hypothetical protein
MAAGRRTDGTIFLTPDIMFYLSPTIRGDTTMAAKKTRKLNLALQGGGSHGAFTWGVLDRLLEEESIEIAAISGTLSLIHI